MVSLSHREKDLGTLRGGSCSVHVKTVVRRTYPYTPWSLSQGSGTAPIASTITQPRKNSQG